ncbi:3-phosphoshikimate 1-carboxyvinyltransferase [Actinomyces marmotae]|uniref:3-phosphoshikimate 1-carboxyvinyltransferase n=1 Tax=Actinomyces marmotae TaxID=2737173 RepID=A0A6M8AXU0_9ACTO|nr:3-phosphoshikimate 1-carboxyvinyltransferase [Actinomyces marmotae]QKD79239.1 3-phosphoshikimate 1-carboxyvinyltransferase [Actinomyces marmotae]
MHYEPTDAPAWAAPRALGPLNAVVELPGSKSLTARELVLAATAAGPSTLAGVLRARDTDLMIAALTTLGARFEEDGSPTRLRVTPAPIPFPVSRSERPTADATASAPARIDCGLAGTVMRFIPPLAALADAPLLFDGDDAARSRPLGPLLDAVSALGARVDYLAAPGFLPVLITPGTPAGAGAAGAGAGNAVAGAGAANARAGAGTGPRGLAIDSTASSQFLSALLLAAPLLPDGARITPTGRVPSLPHVAMTVASLRERGVSVEEPATGVPEGERAWAVAPGRPAGASTTIEPDLSNAGPFLAAALVAGGTVSVPHWPASTSQAGDAWRGLLPRLGGTIRLIQESDGAPVLQATGTGALAGIDADLSAVGELTPTVAALAVLASAQGHTSRLRGIAHLRGHETDRLAAIVAEARRLGAPARETADGIEVGALAAGTQLRPALLHSYADHRMATFAAIIGLAVPGVRLDDVACTSKTLPGFTGLWGRMLASASPAAPGREAR